VIGRCREVLEPVVDRWFWWDATRESADAAVIGVAIASLPAPLGALKWLLRAAGAVEVAVSDSD
jgi:hypothetical protein